MPTYKFIGFIYKLGANRCVDVPPEIYEKLGNENFIPVTISVAGIIKHTNLIPSGQGEFRLFVDSEIRKATGKDAGQFIEIEIKRNTEPRDTNPPDDLQSAFENNKTAETVFYNSTTNKQREIIKYLSSAKTIETRLKRIDYIISILLQEASKRKRK